MARPQLDTGGETAVEYAVNRIKERIRDGGFAAGQRLVAGDLVRTIGVSAGPIREAIRKLAGEGIIEIQPNRGAVIRELSRRDIVEIFETREAIEGQAARLAAHRVGHGDHRQHLGEVYRRLGQAHGQRDHDAYNAANQAFHECVMTMSGNSRIAQLADALALPIYVLRYHQLLKGDSIDMSMSEHDQIFKAIDSGDEDRAELLMRRHVRNSGEQILSGLAKVGGSLVGERHSRRASEVSA